MDGRGDVVLAGKFGRSDLDLFKPNSAHALADRLLQFEPVGHGSAELLQTAHDTGDGFGPARPRGRTSGPASATALRGRMWPPSPAQALERSAQASQLATRASGRGSANN